MNCSRFTEIKVTYNGATLSSLAKNNTFPVTAIPLLRPSDRRSTVALLYEWPTAGSSLVKPSPLMRFDQTSNSFAN